MKTKSNPRIKYIDPKCRHVKTIIGILNRYIASKKYLKDFEDINPDDEGTEFPSLERRLKRHFKLKLLGTGCSRSVYQLTTGLVLKLNRYGEETGDYDYNRNELRACIKHPKDTAKPYLHYRDINAGVDILVSQRAKIYNYKKHETKYSKRYKALNSKFRDIHDDNLGIIKGKLVAIDLGHETGK